MGLDRGAGEDGNEMTPVPLVDPRHKKLLELMAASANRPASTDTAVPNTHINLQPTQPSEPRFDNPVPLGGNQVGNLPQPAEMSMPTSGPVNPDGYSAHAPAPRIGVSLKGLTGVDKSLADLAVNRDAARDFPSSKVRDGEILPPKMHHGLGDRLKSIGKGIVLAMGQQAARGDNSTAGLLSAGAAGGTVSGISPVTGDALLRRAQVGQQEGDVARELDIAKEQGQVGAINAEPGLRAERIRVDQEIASQKAAQVTASESDRMARDDAARKAAGLRDMETQRHNRVTEGQGQQKVDKPTPVRGEETPQQYRSRLGQYRAAQKELGDLEKQEQDAAQRKDAAYARASSLKDWMNRKVNDETGSPVYGDDVERAERQAESAEKNWQDYAGKKAAAQAKLVQYGEDDGSEPKQAGPQLKGSSPDARKGTISKQQQQRWLTDNPGKSLEDMKALYPNAVMQ